MSLIACLALLLALGSGGTGCTSIYHRTRTELPPEPTAELSLRVTEARRAETLAERAGARLLDSLQRRKPGTITETDFDRLEAAAFDMERQVWAARDAAERSGKPVDCAKEIERLRRQATAWLDYVHANRPADPVTQLQQLQGMLQ